MNNVQEDIHVQLKEGGGEIILFLKKGLLVRGKIIAIDKFTVFMLVRGKQQLVYKQAISTISK
ncbi:RNA-binding protein Hfq [Bacillus cereus]|uniref:RNA-binding protein Hfq n=1 Tax=Bacillus cereus TaxID=1396 RepID=A0A9X7CIY1_BACCE|nr:RNA chaperone Hfq [Bacillus cereus]PGS68793.1 RNA-binding protein Hfq [Bacillus cereus]